MNLELKVSEIKIQFFPHPNFIWGAVCAWQSVGRPFKLQGSMGTNYKVGMICSKQQWASLWATGIRMHLWRAKVLMNENQLPREEAVLSEEKNDCKHLEISLCRAHILSSFYGFQELHNCIIASTDNFQ